MKPTRPRYTRRLIREWENHERYINQTSGNIAEIGCNKGDTTLLFVSNFVKRKTYAIDWITDNPTMPKDQVNEIPKVIAGHAVGFKNLIVIDTNSQKYDFNKLENVTYFFVDGDHSYNGVKSDTDKAIEYLKNRNGGIIALHDYRNDDKYPWIEVKKYVDNELAGKYELDFPWRTKLAVIRVHKA